MSKMADNLHPNEVLIKNLVSTAGLCVVELALVRILSTCMLRLSYSSNEALVQSIMRLPMIDNLPCVFCFTTSVYNHMLRPYHYTTTG